MRNKFSLRHYALLLAMFCNFLAVGAQSVVPPSPIPVTYLLLCCRTMNNGTKFQVNGNWEPNHDYRNINTVRDILQKIKDAGINCVGVDFTNPSMWDVPVKDSNGNLVDDFSSEFKPMLDNVIKVCQEKDMKWFMFLGDPNAWTMKYWNTIAKRVWEQYAETPNYMRYGFGDDRPMLVMFLYGTAFWDNYNRTPDNEKDYIARFHLGTCQINGAITPQTSDGWGYRNYSQSSDGNVRFVSPNGGVPPEDWCRVDADEWRRRVDWGLQAHHYTVFGSYDDTCDGIFWGIADVSSSTSQYHRNASTIKDPYIYYNIVREKLAANASGVLSQQIDRTRETKVYYGAPDRFNETSDVSLFPLWKYTREHVTGLYISFVDAWKQKYQSGGRTQSQIASELSEAFPKKSLLWEGSMENQVNGDPNGRTDNAFETEVFNYYKNAGFSIDYGAINYMSNTENGTVGINDTRNSIADCKAKIQHYYDEGVGKVLYLCGPWTAGGDLYNSNDARVMASWTDGIMSDGPIGYWVGDVGNFRRNSRDIVRYSREHNLTSALMIAPFSVDNTAGYSPYNGGFLKVARQYVFDQEDNNCMPDLWTLWNYGGEDVKLLNQFPESKIVDGAAQPQNTFSGIAYWLLYHLNECPVARPDDVPDGVTLHGNRNFSAKVAKGETLTLKLKLQSPNKWIELAPVLNAIVMKNSEQWQFAFTLNGKDITDAMTKDGGFNCIGNYRIAEQGELTLTISAKALTDDAATELRIEAISNAAHTVNSRIISRIVLNSEFIPSEFDDDPEDVENTSENTTDNYIPDDYQGTPRLDMYQKIPGCIECERFDNGGKDVAWHWNNGPFAGSGRDPGDGIAFIFGGMQLGWLSSRDENWANYSVEVERTANYNVKSNTAIVRIDIDGYSSEKGVSLTNIPIRAGRHVMKVWYYEGNGDGDNLEFSESGNYTSVQAMEMPSDKAKDNIIYNLQGQRLSRLVRGINIVNGKKVLVK